MHNIFVGSDPQEKQLGSAGGTVNLLHRVWLADQPAESDFAAWLARSVKLIIHGSGESRRLPAYAATGKPLVPLPPLWGVRGQYPNQVLLDLQIGTYERLFRCAPACYRVMVACGDVLLRHAHWLPAYPEADVLIFGITASVEEAAQHGVLICPVHEPQQLEFFLQKPPPEELKAIGLNRIFYLDTGIWLLSSRAVAALMRKCGWDEKNQSFVSETPHTWDLYSSVGPALGARPVAPDPEFSSLRCAVLPLPDGRFYHFGTNRSLLASVAQLQLPAEEQRSFGHSSLESRPPPWLSLRVCSASSLLPTAVSG